MYSVVAAIEYMFIGPLPPGAGRYLTTLKTGTDHRRQILRLGPTYLFLFAMLEAQLLTEHLSDFSSPHLTRKRQKHIPILA